LSRKKDEVDFVRYRQQSMSPNTTTLVWSAQSSNAKIGGFASGGRYSDVYITVLLRQDPTSVVQLAKAINSKLAITTGSRFGSEKTLEEKQGDTTPQPVTSHYLDGTQL
jgi:hypothetical protein